MPGQAARLYPGVYSINSSNYIQIVRKGQRFCMADVSRNEKTFASLRPDRKHPSLYQVNGLLGKAVYQQDGNTIFWGPVNQMAREAAIVNGSKPTCLFPVICNAVLALISRF